MARLRKKENEGKGNALGVASEEQVQTPEEFAYIRLKSTGHVYQIAINKLSEYLLMIKIKDLTLSVVPPSLATPQETAEAVRTLRAVIDKYEIETYYVEISKLEYDAGDKDGVCASAS